MFKSCARDVGRIGTKLKEATDRLKLLENEESTARAEFEKLSKEKRKKQVEQAEEEMLLIAVEQFLTSESVDIP